MEFRILGSLEAETATGERLALGGPNERKALAVLLLDAGRGVPLSRLVDALWDDDPPATAVKQAQNAVGRVRRALARSGEPGPIVTESAGYRVLLDWNSLDAEEFESKVAQAEVATAAAAQIPKLRFATTRTIVAGIALAVAGVLLIIATHWGHFG